MFWFYLKFGGKTSKFRVKTLPSFFLVFTLIWEEKQNSTDGRFTDLGYGILNYSRIHTANYSEINIPSCL